MAIRVTLVGGDAAGRDRLGALLRAAPTGYHVVASGSCEEAMSDGPASADAHLVLASDPPSLMLEVIRALRTGRAPVIVVGAVDRHALDVAALEAGAAGYVVADGGDPAHLDRWIRYACAARRDFSDEVTSKDLVMQLALARGSSVREAALVAGVSERTVYRRNADPGFRAGVDRLRAQLVQRLVARTADVLAFGESGGLTPR